MPSASRPRDLIGECQGCERFARQAPAAEVKRTLCSASTGEQQSRRRGLCADLRVSRWTRTSALAAVAGLLHVPGAAVVDATVGPGTAHACRRARASLREANQDWRLRRSCLLRSCLLRPSANGRRRAARPSGHEATVSPPDATLLLLPRSDHPDTRRSRRFAAVNSPRAWVPGGGSKRRSPPRRGCRGRLAGT
jgi:hypothetical protein